MSEVYVTTDSIMTGSYHSGEEFGEWSESSSFYVNTASLTKPDESFEKVEIGVDVEVGDIVYALYMTYSSGDSFGSSSGNGEVVWVFKDQTLAYRAVRAIEKDQDKQALTFETDIGTMVRLSNPAYGYFECLENVDVVELLVEE